jgi:hypothetical protein
MSRKAYVFFSPLFLSDFTGGGLPGPLHWTRPPERSSFPPLRKNSSREEGEGEGEGEGWGKREERRGRECWKAMKFELTNW